MEEFWKDIKEYEGRYQVSNLGRVRSLNYNKTGKTAILKARAACNGYIMVYLKKHGVGKKHLVHRLMADAFLPNPNMLSDVDHKDENRSNNFIFVNRDGTVNEMKSNLQWLSHKANCNRGTRNIRLGKRLYQYTLDGVFVNSYETARDAARLLGYNAGHISECCNGNRKQANGYRWSFVEI